jgi:hypothetical protein
MTAAVDAAVAAAAPVADKRRLTEHDPDFLRLHAETVRRLNASLRTLVQELRTEPTTPASQATGGHSAAVSRFIARHVGILRDCYETGHQEGAKDYWQGVSLRRNVPSADIDEQRWRQIFTFYAPSVAKMAHEALLAAAQTRAGKRLWEPPERSYLLAGGYNPYRDSHGRFAPGPHAPRPGTGGSGGTGGGTGTGGTGGGSHIGQSAHTGAASQAQIAHARSEARKARLAARTAWHHHVADPQNSALRHEYEAKQAEADVAHQRLINALRPAAHAQFVRAQAVLAAHQQRIQAAAANGAARTDLHGQAMPFSRDEFEHALTTSGRRFSAGNVNETYRVTINGREYMAKTADANSQWGRYDAFAQARNEAATVECMKVLGNGDMVAEHAYHVIGSDGRSWSVQTLEAGRAAGAFASTYEAAVKIGDPEMFSRAYLAQYVLGMQDRHPGNVLIDPAGRKLVEIDHGYGFKHDNTVEFRDTVKKLWSARVGGARNMELDRGHLTHLLTRANDVLATMERFGMDKNSHEARWAYDRMFNLMLFNMRGGKLTPGRLRALVGDSGEPGVSVMPGQTTT